MLVIEESQKEDLPLWDSLKEEYPFQFPPPEIIAENEAYILSRYPINAEYRYVHYGEETGKFIRLSVTKDGLPEPISIYVNHTKVPLGERAHASRDMKLNAVSMEIRSDQSQHIIAIGDWNVTPFSPAFHDFVQNSRLRYTYFGVWPLTSWPSFLFLPFLKIPIDHTMSSPNLTLINQIRGPHMYSDHHPLISTFVISR